MSHWYEKLTGKPLYTLIGINGKERDTTLRDAKKLGLVPSVTTIIAEAASPGLDIYRQQQLLDACINQPYCCGIDISLEEWKRLIVQASKEHAKKAAQRGTEIHDSLEHWFQNGIYDSNKKFVTPVIEFLHSKFPNVEWVSEASFGHGMGFGGKVDLHSKTHNIVLDFKTKDKNEKEFESIKAYDTHGMQTAAYTVGLGIGPIKNLGNKGVDLFDPPLGWNEEQNTVIEFEKTKRYNLFISTQVPGLLKLTESTDFQKDWHMFWYLLSYWKLRNNI